MGPRLEAGQPSPVTPVEGVQPHTPGTPDMPDITGDFLGSQEQRPKVFSRRAPFEKLAEHARVLGENLGQEQPPLSQRFRDWYQQTPVGRRPFIKGLSTLAAAGVVYIPWGNTGTDRPIIDTPTPTSTATATATNTATATVAPEPSTTPTPERPVFPEVVRTVVAEKRTIENRVRGSNVLPVAGFSRTVDAEEEGYGASFITHVDHPKPYANLDFYNDGPDTYMLNTPKGQLRIFLDMEQGMWGISDISARQRYTDIKFFDELADYRDVAFRSWTDAASGHTLVEATGVTIDGEVRTFVQELTLTIPEDYPDYPTDRMTMTQIVGPSHAVTTTEIAHLISTGVLDSSLDLATTLQAAGHRLIVTPHIEHLTIDGRLNPAWDPNFLYLDTGVPQYQDVAGVINGISGKRFPFDSYHFVPEYWRHPTGLRDATDWEMMAQHAAESGVGYFMSPTGLNENLPSDIRSYVPETDPSFASQARRHFYEMIDQAISVQRPDGENTVMLFTNMIKLSGTGSTAWERYAFKNRADFMYEPASKDIIKEGIRYALDHGAQNVGQRYEQMQNKTYRDQVVRELAKLDGWKVPDADGVLVDFTETIEIAGPAISAAAFVGGVDIKTMADIDVCVKPFRGLRHVTDTIAAAGIDWRGVVNEDAQVAAMANIVEGFLRYRITTGTYGRFDEFGKDDRPKLRLLAHPVVQDRIRAVIAEQQQKSGNSAQQAEFTRALTYFVDQIEQNEAEPIRSVGTYDNIRME